MSNVQPIGNAEENHAELATHEDVTRVLHSLDDPKLIDILNLRPTVKDLEEAALWLGGDPDIFGSGQPLKGVAGEIVSILTADEDEEPAAMK